MSMNMTPLSCPVPGGKLSQNLPSQSRCGHHTLSLPLKHSVDWYYHLSAAQLEEA